MSPTPPTFVTLNDQLNKAHHRIRELEARETELLAQIRTLGAAIAELTHDGRQLAPIAVQRWESDGGAIFKLRNQRSIDA